MVKSDTQDGQQLVYACKSGGGLEGTIDEDFGHVIKLRSNEFFVKNQQMQLSFSIDNSLRGE